MAKKKAGTPQPKKSKKKLVFFLILLILIAVLGVLAFFFWENIQDQFGGDKEKQAMEEKLRVEQEVKKAEDKKAKEEEDRQRRQKMMAKKYYVEVGECLYMSCTKDLKRQVARLGLPAYAVVRTKKTEYHHLVSTFAYDYERATLKLKALNALNNRLPAAVLYREKNKYRISFGNFPDRERGMEMKRYLDQLYPNLQLSFKLLPKMDSIRITKIYSGPFLTILKAKRSQKKLKKQPGIAASFVTTNP